MNLYAMVMYGMGVITCQQIVQMDTCIHHLQEVLHLINGDCMMYMEMYLNFAPVNYPITIRRQWHMPVAAPGGAVKMPVAFLTPLILAECIFMHLSATRDSA